MNMISHFDITLVKSCLNKEIIYLLLLKETKSLTNIGIAFFVGHK